MTGSGGRCKGLNVGTRSGHVRDGNDNAIRLLKIGNGGIAMIPVSRADEPEVTRHTFGPGIFFRENRMTGECFVHTDVYKYLGHFVASNKEKNSYFIILSIFH